MLIEQEEGKPPPVQARQGDIFAGIPSVVVDERPLRVARDFIPKSGRITYNALSEDSAPTPPFDWKEGERIVVKGNLGMGILMTQDCEIDKPKARVTFALVRPIPAGIPEGAVEAWKNRKVYRIFYLGEQGLDPRFGPAYVDFGRLTTFTLEASLVLRQLSLSDAVRDVFREAFIEFVALNRKS